MESWDDWHAFVDLMFSTWSADEMAYMHHVVIEKYNIPEYTEE